MDIEDEELVDENTDGSKELCGKGSNNSTKEPHCCGRRRRSQREMSTNKRNLNICEIYHFAEDFSDVKATRDSNLTVPLLLLLMKNTFQIP